MVDQEADAAGRTVEASRAQVGLLQCRKSVDGVRLAIGRAVPWASAISFGGTRMMRPSAPSTFEGPSGQCAAALDSLETIATRHAGKGRLEMPIFFAAEGKHLRAKSETPPRRISIYRALHYHVWSDSIAPIGSTPAVRTYRSGCRAGKGVLL